MSEARARESRPVPTVPPSVGHTHLDPLSPQRGGSLPSPKRSGHGELLLRSVHQNEPSPTNPGSQRHKRVTMNASTVSGQCH